MKAENIIIAHPKDIEQANIIKAFMKALKIKFETSKKENSYDIEFLEKISKSQKEFENGEYTRVKKDELQNLLGL